MRWIRMGEKVEMSLETKGKETNKDIVYKKRKEKMLVFILLILFLKYLCLF